ncbi:hypothetical protein C0993_012701 [Termitomyces sp. T159_Od127]|nr:hypothetical protein C0993_012701 [Termitomyces sp. T159_Od127]
MPDVTTTPPATPIDVNPEPEPKQGKKRPRQRKRARQAISIVLENSGSVARDHLASERTFLAYIRTSLLFASTGVALVQLFAIASPSTPLTRFARPLGATLVIFALVVLAFGVRRYFLVQNLLTQGKFPLTRISPAALAAVTAIIIIIVFAILVSSRN